MNGFFQINPYYNDIKQEIVVPYTAATTSAAVVTAHPQAIQTVVPHPSGHSTETPLETLHSLSKSQRRFLHESPEARAKRLARNAERMRQKRAAESEDEYRKRMAQNAERMRKKRAAETQEEYLRRMQRNEESKSSDEYQIRLAKNAERNRLRRQNETEIERSIRRARSAARERLRRAMETPEQRAIRLAKLAERMRIARANETPEQRAIRLAKNAAKAKQRLLNESPEQWIERKRKKAEYARQKRSAAATIGKLGFSTSCNSSSSNASSSSLSVPSTPVDPTAAAATGGFSHTTANASYNLDHNQTSLVSLASPVHVKDIKLISPLKPGQMLQLPEQLYATPHIPFNGADLKPPEFLTSNSQPGGHHHVMQPDLYKFHILPYTFSPTAGAVQPTQADYKVVINLEMGKLNFKTIASYDTVQPADSVEWCPHEGWEQMFVCGTYELERDENLSSAKRKGCILLHRFDGKTEGDPLKLLQTVERSAVLDQKWNPSFKNCLAAAGADGTVAVYGLEEFAGQEPQLKHQATRALLGDETDERNLLALAVDWSSDGKRLIVSDSHGHVELFTFESDLQSVHSWKVHGFEAWTCAFNRHNENVIFSGGDDCMLCMHDIRCPTEPATRCKNKSHSAGVTSLLSFAQREHVLLTGSYDENIRLFDERQLKGSISELALQGGVWRLRSNPLEEPDRILCACMYHNFSVVQLLPDDTFELVGEYGEHESICYGCDWQHVGSSLHRSKRVIATCSFYDHKLCVAEVEEQE
uniref:methylated diphthine methylhydrolase n=1 Tax=Anopheles farauti TaxID=69004 RepID=A0A182QVW6_9DIPT